MQGSVKHDQLVMSIVFHARQQLPEAQDHYVRTACGSNSHLYHEVMEALVWENRMGLFLVDPLMEGSQLCPFQPGEVLLERFEIVRQVGEGGMSFVYEALDRRRRNQRIAIKVAKPGFQRLLSPELEGALTVRHHNVCLVNEIHTASTKAGELDFLTMEFLEGETLAAHLFEQGRLAPAKAREIALQLCAGLAEAHRSGVIHRDLKSGNVMLCANKDGSCRAVITDFGLAWGPDFAASVSGGTPGYMAPEVRRGEPGSRQADLYALGVVLYEMIVGQKPVEASLSGETPEHGPVAPTALIADLDPRWDQAIMPCLSPAPADRPSSAELVAARLTKWRVPRKFVLPPVLALVILVAIALGVPKFRARVLEYMGKAKPAPNVNTVVLADVTGDAPIADTLKTALAIQLEQSPFLNVLSEQKVGETLKLMNRPAAQPLTEEVAREICLRSNGRMLLSGSVGAVGEHYLFAVKAIDCQNGDTLAAAEAEAPNKEKLLRAVNEAGNELRAKLGELPASRERFNTPLEQATTSSLEALQAFTQARRAQTTGYADPIPFYSRAVELDPKFAAAYVALGTAYDNAGQPTLATENYEKAYQLRDRVSQRERFLIEGHYYDSVTGEVDMANDTYNEWARDYAGDWQPHLNLSWNYAVIGRYDEAAKEGRLALQANPDNTLPYCLLMFIYNSKNQPENTKAQFDAAHSRSLENYYLHLYRYHAAFLEQDAKAMQQQVAWAMGKPGAEDTLLAAESDTEAYHGHLSKARELSDQAVRVAERSDSREQAAEWEAAAALREAEIGDEKRARQEAEEALKLAPGRDVRIMAALSLARAGAIAEAGKLADQLDSEFPRNTMIQNYSMPTIRAAIELKRNHLNKAISILQVTEPYELGIQSFGSMYPAYLRGEAYLQAGRGHDAVLELRKVIGRPGVTLNSVTGALAYLQLARAERMAGDENSARKHYQDFLNLWKDADPNRPTLQVAKAEYQRLN